MPVYNGEKYLRDAIDSILFQTFEDFEFIIVNDGSKDKTEEIILSYIDPRIVYIKNSENLQISKSLNKGISIAQGKYIARMDADDISLPERFERQYYFMESNPHIGLCGTWLETFGKISEVWKMPTSHDEIAITLLFNSCIMHPTVFLRKSILLSLSHIYDYRFDGAEDYELWTRLIFHTKFSNFPQILFQYRIHDFSPTRSYYKENQEILTVTVRNQYLNSLNLANKNVDISVHNRILKLDIESSKEEILNAYNWFLFLINNLTIVAPSLGEMGKVIILEKAYSIFSRHQKKKKDIWHRFLAFKSFFALSGFRVPLLQLKLFVKILK